MSQPSANKEKRQIFLKIIAWQYYETEFKTDQMTEN